MGSLLSLGWAWGVFWGAVLQGQCRAAGRAHLGLELPELCLQPGLGRSQVAKFGDQVQRQWLQV